MVPVVNQFDPIPRVRGKRLFTYVIKCNMCGVKSRVATAARSFCEKCTKINYVKYGYKPKK